MSDLTRVIRSWPRAVEPATVRSLDVLHIGVAMQSVQG